MLDFSGIKVLKISINGGKNRISKRSKYKVLIAIEISIIKGHKNKNTEGSKNVMK